MKTIVTIIVFCGIIQVRPSRAEEVSGQQLWRDEAIGFIDGISDAPTPEEVEKLSRYAGIEYPNQAVSNLQSEVSREAKKRLSQIPNHAELFERKLLDLREKKNQLNYDLERYRVFRGFGHVKSVQNIDLLIRLLDDNIDTRSDGGEEAVRGNDSFATTSLVWLVENPPLEKNRFGLYINQLEAWREWGGEIRNGGRTFRFKGDSQLYNIKGMVSREMPLSCKNEADIPKIRKEQNIEEFVPDDERARPFPRVVVIISLLFLVVAVYFCFGRRQAA